MDDPDPNMPKKVVVDRYRKHIREADADRGEANYAKSAAAGALAGLVARLKKTPAAHRAMIGAGAGLLAEGITRAVGRGTKDYYGERSRVAKRSEKLPIYGGLGVAGVLAHQRVRRALKDFSKRSALVEFGQGPFITAVRLKSGKIVSHSNAIDHSDLLRRKKINPEDVAAKGFVLQSPPQAATALPIGTPGERTMSDGSPMNAESKARQDKNWANSHQGRLIAKRLRAQASQRFIETEPREFAISDTLRRKLITAAALAGGITAADAATSAAYPADDETRRQATVKGVKQGAIYGGVLAASEPALRSLIHRFHDRRRIIELGESLEEVAIRKQAELEAARGGTFSDRPKTEPASGRPFKFLRLNEDTYDVHHYEHGRIGQLSKSWHRLGGAGWTTPGKNTQLGKTRQDAARMLLRDFKKAARAAHDELAARFRLTEFRALNPSDQTGKLSRYGKEQLSLPIEFSSFIKDVAFKDLPAAGRKDIRAFHPAIGDDTLVSHYGMVAKELSGKADPQNLAAARKNVGKLSKKACADEVMAQRGKKFVLLNNDQIVDGHHFLAKAERGRVTASLHVIDLTPSRFQEEVRTKGAKNLQRQMRRAVEFGSGGAAQQARKLISSFREGIIMDGPRGSIKAGFPVSARGGHEIRVLPRDASTADSALNRLLKRKKGEGTQNIFRKAHLAIRMNAAKAIIRRETENPSRFQRKLRRAVEFMYSEGAAGPQSNSAGQPDWVQQRRKNKKRSDQLDTAVKVTSIAGGVAALGDIAGRFIDRRRHLGPRIGAAVKYDVHHLADLRKLIEFKQQREQLREGGKSEAEKGSGRYAHPIKVLAKLQSAYAKSPGGVTHYYGPGGENLPIAHAQVLRSAYAHAGSVRKLAGRAGGLLRDTADVAAGNPRRADAYGRPQRREWEKPWFHRVAKDALLGAGILGGAVVVGRSPKLQGHIMRVAGAGKRWANKQIPDLLAGRKFTKEPVEFAAMPIKYGGKINYNEQDYVFELTRALRKMVRKNAGLPARPPITKSVGVESKTFSSSSTRRPVELDDVANYAGWDVRDPRGRSARVFAPGSQRRVRREKEWHERVDNQRKLLLALAGVGTVAGGLVGHAIGRKKLRLPISPKTSAHPSFRWPGGGEGGAAHVALSRIIRDHAGVYAWGPGDPPRKITVAPWAVELSMRAGIIRRPRAIIEGPWKCSLA
jgi:hypothetical protein